MFGLAATWINPAYAQSRTFDLATYTGQGFELYAVDSGVSTFVPCKVAVADFSIAPNGHFLVIESRASKVGIGLLYELDLTTQDLRQLPSERFYFRTAKEGERELYSDPAVSPDGRSVAFTVYAVEGNDSDDLVGLAGPLAVLDLNSGQRRVVAATRRINGQPAFVNNPVWSSDGRRLLIAFEVGGAIVDVGENRIQLLDSLMTKQLGDGNTSPMAWRSDHEIYFVWNPTETNRSGVGKLYLLNVHRGLESGGWNQDNPVPERSIKDRPEQIPRSGKIVEIADLITTTA